MSLPRFGRVTPFQAKMLQLAGLVSGSVDHQSDDDKILAIRKARAGLCQSTGHDFGYVLRDWHDYLMADARYKYVVGTEIVALTIHDDILKMEEDAERQRLVSLLSSQKSA